MTSGGGSYRTVKAGFLFHCYSRPYLGALGHLVAIRATDLAYLHVHPLERRGGPGEVPFAIEVPSPGSYRLFFDFSHQGTVRTAAFTVDVAGEQAGPPDHRGARRGALTRTAEWANR